MKTFNTANPIGLQKFFSDMLGNIGRETKLNSIAGFSEELDGFRRRLNDNFFRLAVIGEFSSGKSTFINALLGRDILSHATKETTAVLTRIVNVAENDLRLGTAIAFMKSGQTLPIENFDAIKDYTTAVSTKYQVAQEIDAVEIYMPVINGACPLMIMDTPGLNGTAEGHLEQTKDIVKKSHACIYLIQQRGLTKDDLEFLRENLIPCQRRFIFVQNFIDEFNAIEGETLEERLNVLQTILKEKIFFDAPNHEFFTCGISALKELASHDTQIKRLYATDTEDLTDDDRRRLARESNFDSFRELLVKNFGETQLDEIRYRDTAVAVLYWVKSLQGKISRRLADDNEIYQTSREKNVAERIERLIQKIQDRRDDNLTAIRGFIANEIRTLNRELEKIVTDKTNELEESLSRGINDCTTTNDIEQKRNSLPKEISKGLERVSSETVDYCKTSFQYLYQSVMERVEEYSGIRSVSFDEKFSVDLPTEQRQFSSQSSIVRREYELSQKQNELSNNRSTSWNDNLNLRNAEANARRLDSEVAGIQWRINQKQNEIRNMGSRPAERVYYEEVAVERGGFFGSIMDIFSTKYEQQEQRDDSAGREWDRRRRKLQEEQNALALQLDESRKKKQGAERTLNRYRGDAQNSAAKIQRLEGEISRLEEQIRIDKERLEKEKEVARKEYIRTCKNQLRDEVRKYLHGDDGEAQHLLDALKKNTAQGERNIYLEAEKNFNDSITCKLAELEEARQGNTSPLQENIAGLEQASRNLARYAERMEEILA